MFVNAFRSAYVRASDRSSLTDDLSNNDPQPWWFGYSTGKWLGDTLVVETSGFRDGEVTVDDPKAYTRPWTVTIKNEIMLDTELIEFICLENEQSTKHFR